MDHIIRANNAKVNPCVVVWNLFIFRCVTSDGLMGGLLLFKMMMYKDSSQIAQIFSMLARVLVLLTMENNSMIKLLLHVH